MKLVATDFAKLKWSLLVAVVMLAIGGAAVYFAIDASTRATHDRQIAQTERDSADGKLRRVRQEEDDIKQKSVIFNTLRQRGAIGEEQRLEWVELLKAIRLDRQLLELQYEIAPQRPLDMLTTQAGAQPDGGGYGFFASAMKVQLKLLHEEDLTRLLADLQARASALIFVRSCDVSRLPNDASQAGVQPKLAADCLLDWVTLREVSAK